VDADGVGEQHALQIPTLDNRRYPELLDEALQRIPVHNPEWTNFNASDPGVTLIELSPSSLKIYSIAAIRFLNATDANSSLC
jgi:hypothetical protein